MESSAKETTIFTKPCPTLFSSVDNVVRAILKCLGFEQLDNTLKDSSSNSSSESDQQSDGEANSVESDASSTTALDPTSCTDPPTTETSEEGGTAVMISARRPSIDKGKGPSIN